MKTETKSLRHLQRKIFVPIIIFFLFLPYYVIAQEEDSKQTLFKSGYDISELWTPEIKINSIQDDLGTLLGFYGGPVFNNKYLFGISGGLNLSHPRVNYGYLGAIGQYIYNQSNLVHFSGQLVLAYGSTKDYEHTKSNLFDNFWNISGAGFFMMEPGANIELNLSNRLTLVTGISYRIVTGLNEDSENVSITHVTNNDLSGLNFNIGLKISKKIKEKQQ